MGSRRELTRRDPPKDGSATIFKAEVPRTPSKELLIKEYSDLCKLRNAMLSENIDQHVCHRVQRSSGDFSGFGMSPAFHVEVFGNGHRADDERSWVDDRAWADRPANTGLITCSRWIKSAASVRPHELRSGPQSLRSRLHSDPESHRVILTGSYNPSRKSKIQN
jgi:hypothetical protein